MQYEIKVPEAGFNIPECTIAEWTKGIGDRVEEGETVVVLDTEKLSVDVPAEGAGLLIEIRYRKGDTVSVGAVLGVISSDGIRRRKDTSDSAVPPPTRSRTGADNAFKAGAKERGPGATPAAKATAKKEGVLLEDIGTGSGPGGRIVKEDVHAYRSGIKTAQDRGKEKHADNSADKKVLLTGWRKVIDERMTRSAREVPQYFQCLEVDVTGLADTVAGLKVKEGLPKITYLPFVIKAIAVGTEVIPSVNAIFHGDCFIMKHDVNIGIAVDVGEKLIVPVVRDVRKKSIVELSREIGDLVDRARKDSLEHTDIEGGTITVTNIGVYGMYMGIPIILQPQAAIISMGNIRETLVMNGDVVVKKKFMILGGSFDHRIVNGGPAARFLQEVKVSLENLDHFMIKLH
jgi:pyruvate/2-oxoglutarate dehydrogenase complex dihydrolipoamide acyltransferase (E2) component